MKHVTLKAKNRELTTKGYLKQLRRDGKVPAVLHNKGADSIHIYVESSEFKKAIQTAAGTNVILNLEVKDGEKHLARIENIQYDILRENVYTHVDFGKISLDQKIESDIPVIITGQEERVADDGVLSQTLHELTILSTPDDIPANIHADVSKLTIGDVIFVRDLELPKGCESALEPDEAVVTIIAPRIAEEPTTEESEDGSLASDAEPQEPELVE